MEKKILNFELEIPILRIKAKYNLNGHILLLPLIGSGDVNLALKDVKTAVYTRISLRNAPEVSISLSSNVIGNIFKYY